MFLDTLRVQSHIFLKYSLLVLVLDVFFFLFYSHKLASRKEIYTNISQKQIISMFLCCIKNISSFSPFLMVSSISGIFQPHILVRKVLIEEINTAYSLIVSKSLYLDQFHSWSPTRISCQTECLLINITKLSLFFRGCERID